MREAHANPDAPGNMDRQALAGVSIDHHHHIDCAAVIGPVERGNRWRRWLTNR
jgi:hypothetical protein